MSPPVLFHYAGGKSESVDWYLGLTPPHEISVEVFCGHPSWTLAKPSALVEVINDVSADITRLFRVLRADPAGLAAAVAATPYARRDWEEARAALSAGVASGASEFELARCYLTVLRQSLSSAPGRAWSRVKAHSRRDMASSCSRWLNVPDACLAVADRLRTVQVENLDFERCLLDYDSPETLFFCDPPYLPGTCSGFAAYAHTMTYADHLRLLRRLVRLRGSVMLCGYSSRLYDVFLSRPGWKKHRLTVPARSAVQSSGRVAARSTREECLWIKSPL